ncbi:MAG: 30S ribosomal protein S20 [Nitrospinota bacterium]|nr:30S ribosomal protein S20 [Nitrospinota bacterium]
MEHSPSAKKRHRQNLIRNSRNRSVRTQLRNKIKIVRDLTEKKEDSDSALIEAQRSLSKAATRHIIHKKTASRLISRLAKLSQK